MPLIHEIIRKHSVGKNITQDTQSQNSGWITIVDPSAIKLILESFADEDKKKIMNATLTKSRTIREIIKITKLPKTSGYRNVNFLIDGGLLIAKDTPDIKNGKRYRSIFKNVIINIEGNNVIVKVLPTEDI